MQHLLSIVIVVAAAQTAWAVDPAPWPAAEKSAAIAGCRLSIVVSAERDYMKRHNLTELPQGFRESIAPVIEPFLASCDCMIDQLEKRWTYEDFVARQAELPPIVKEIMTGACAVNRSSPTEPTKEPK